MTELVYSSKR